VGWESSKDQHFLDDLRSSLAPALSAVMYAGMNYSEFYAHALLFSAYLSLQHKRATNPQAKSIAEVGVDRAAFARHMLLELGRQHVKVSSYFAIDPWLSSAVPFREAFEELLRFWPAVKIVHGTGAEASTWVNDSSLHFAFIDAVHDFKHVMLHLKAWWPKIKVGGVLAGHDYAPEKPYRFPGCVRAVQTFATHVCGLSCLVGLPGTTFAMIKRRDQVCAGSAWACARLVE